LKNSPLGAALTMLCPPPTGAPLHSICERDLLLYIRSRVLRRLTIVQTRSGSYRLVVSLSVERHDLILASARGAPREWSSLDSLAKQIRHKYGSPASVALSLNHSSSLPIDQGDTRTRRPKTPATTPPVRSARPQVLNP
jgi:hypothetical protein